MEPTPHTQPVCFGKYLLLEKIGSGGMAEIYRARAFAAHGFEKEYAIKKILPTLAPDNTLTQLFIREAKTSSFLNHPNIAHTFELNEVAGIHYIALEYIAGHDLHSLLARCASQGIKIPTRIALLILSDLLKGLDHIHSAKDRRNRPLGLVHCDITPSNILLGYDGSTKIIDFGVAHTHQHTTSSPTLPAHGKVGYMAPEYMTHKTINPRCDLFSAGVVMFETLAMRRMCRHDNDLQNMLAIRDGLYLRELLSLNHLPRALHTILSRCLAHDPNQRFQTAQEVHHALSDFMLKHHIRATPQHLASFLQTVFKDEYTHNQNQRSQDPEDLSAFPDLLSPLVARYRYREPNGTILGPMSRDTLISILRHRREIGATISFDYQPWTSPEDDASIQTDLLLSPEIPTSLPPITRFPSLASTFGLDASLDLSSAESILSHNPDPSQEEILARVSQVLRVPLHGNLHTTPFAFILHSTFSSAFNLTLNVEHNGVQKHISFFEGKPDHVTSNKPDELFGNFLVEHGAIDTEQLQTALQQLSEFGGRLGDLLVTQGFLTRDRLFHFLSLQIRRKLLDIFSWNQGSYTISTSPPNSIQPYPLGINTLEILFEGLRTHTPLPLIHTHLRKHLHSPLSLSHNNTSHNSLLTPQELSITMLLHDGTSLQDWAEVSFRKLNIPEEHVLRTAMILLTTHTISFRNQPAKNLDAKMR